MSAPTPPPKETLPLTPVQRVCLAKVRRGETRGVFETAGVRVGPLDLELFGRAWREVQRAVPVLRTSFVWEDGGEPVQRVHGEPGGELEVEDWRDGSLTEQRTKVEGWCCGLGERALEVGEAPLVRLAAARVTGGVYLVWSHHKLILDRPSAVRLWALLWQVYRGLLTNEPVAVPAFSGLNTHLDWIGQRGSQVASPFWAKALKGAPSATGFPFEKEARDPGGEGAVLKREIAMNPGVIADLGAKLGQHKLGIGILLAGAWAVVLARHSGGRDIVFGISVSGQPAVGADKDVAVGPFAHVIPARVQIDPDDRFAPMLERLQAWRRAARPHEYLPVEMIVKGSGDAEGTPLFETQVDTAPAHPSGASHGAAEGNPPPVLRWYHGDLAVPVTLGIKRLPKIALTLVCDGSRIDRAGADRLLREVRDVMDAFSSDPNIRLGELLEPKGATESEICLLLRGTESPNAPIFLVHAAGGAVAPFASLADQLTEVAPCYAFQPPELDAKNQGRSGRRIEDLGSQYIKAMLHYRQAPPFFLGGWSFGGVVAYEMAVQLSGSVCPPDFVAMFDAPFPTLMPELGETSPSDRLLLYATSIGLEVGPEIAERAREVPLTQIVPRLLSRAKEAGRLASDLTVHRFMKEAGLFLTHIQALRAYRPPRYDGEVIYFAPELEFASEDRESVRAHWKEVCPNLRVVSVPGSHFTMLKLPHVIGLSDALARALRRSEIPFP